MKFESYFVHVWNHVDFKENKSSISYKLSDATQSNSIVGHNLY